MTAPASLHARLIAKQSTAELRRKAAKSRRRGHMTTAEELDVFGRSSVSVMWDALMDDLRDSPVVALDGTFHVSLHTGAER